MSTPRSDLPVLVSGGGIGGLAAALALARAVYTDCMVMHDAVDESLVGRLETGEAFRQRFGNPYAVIHRVDIHTSLLEGVQESPDVEFFTSTRIVKIEQEEQG